MAFRNRDLGPGIVLTLSLGQAVFEVRAIERLHPSLSAPPSVDEGLDIPVDQLTGFRYELLDSGGKVLHRVVGRDPYSRAIELPTGAKFDNAPLSPAERRDRMNAPLQLHLPEAVTRSARRLRMFSPGAAEILSLPPDAPVLDAPIDVSGPRLIVGRAEFHGN